MAKSNPINLSSGTFWTGIGLLGFGAFLIYSGDVEQGIGKVMEGLGLIFLRRAVEGVIPKGL